MESKLLTKEECDFLDKMKYFSCMFYHFRMENLEPAAQSSYPHYVPNKLFLMQVSNPYNRNPTKGMDIGEVKHYNYSFLKEIAGGLSNDNLIQTTTTGRLFRATFEGREVTIKKWDFFDPFMLEYSLYPAKLHNELLAFKNQDFRTHRNFPNLIGFSCEEVLAAVYDCRPVKSLKDEITSDAFQWNDRMNVAIQIGNLIECVHSKGKTVGTIKAKNMGIDKDGIVKLFEIGFNVGEDIPVNPLEIGETLWNYYLFGSYAIYAPGHSDTSLTMKADIYAYGILILELMSKEEFFGLKHYEFVGKARNVVSHGQSLVDKSWKVPKESASTLTEMIINCLHLDPLQRPKISDCLQLLHSLKREDR